MYHNYYSSVFHHLIVLNIYPWFMGVTFKVIDMVWCIFAFTDWVVNADRWSFPPVRKEPGCMGTEEKSFLGHTHSTPLPNQSWPLTKNGSDKNFWGDVLNWWYHNATNNGSEVIFYRIISPCHKNTFLKHYSWQTTRPLTTFNGKPD